MSWNPSIRPDGSAVVYGNSFSPNEVVQIYGSQQKKTGAEIDCSDLFNQAGIGSWLGNQPGSLSPRDVQVYKPDEKSSNEILAVLYRTQNLSDLNIGQLQFGRVNQDDAISC